MIDHGYDDGHEPPPSVTEAARAFDAEAMADSVTAFLDALPDAPDQPICRPSLLVADDDPVFLSAMVCMLELQGMADSITTALTTELALAQLRPEIEIVLLDVHIPLLGGLEAAHRLRQSDYTGQLLLLTSDDDPSLVPQARLVGADEVLLKRDLLNGLGLRVGLQPIRLPV